MRKVIEVGNIDDIAYSDEGILKTRGVHGCTAVMIYGETPKHHGILGHYTQASNNKFFSDFKDFAEVFDGRKNSGVIIYSQDLDIELLDEVKDFLSNKIPNIKISEFPYNHKYSGSGEVVLNIDSGEWKAWFNKKPKRF